MKMKKKLYGILAFVLVALCALGFAFGFAACSGDKDDDRDPLIGTWEGNVEFHIILMKSDFGAATADTTIIVDENTFSLSVKNVDLGDFASFIGGGLMFEDEDYVAIEDATWVNNGDGEYTATADITGNITTIPIVLIEEKKTSYISLTADIALSISGFNVTASFDDARAKKTSDSTTKPWATEEEPEGESESICECGEECTCGEDCECGETCKCENCGTEGTTEKGCTCDDDCTCDENCECDEECTCENCKQSGEE